MCVHAQSLSCLTLCDIMDYSPPGSSVRGISQARIVEWVAIPFSKGSSHPKVKPRSATLQVDSLPSEPPGKLGRLPCPPPGDLPDPGIEPVSLMSPTLAAGS